MITTESWAQFKNTEIGRWIIGEFEDAKKNVQEQMGYGLCIDSGMEKLAINYAKSVGFIEGLDVLLNMDKELSARYQEETNGN